MTSTPEFVNAFADAVAVQASAVNKVYADVLNELLGNGMEIPLVYNRLGSKGLIELGEDECGIWVKMNPKLVYAAVDDGVIPAGLAPYFDESLPKRKRKWSGFTFAAWSGIRRSRVPKDIAERARAIHAEIIAKTEATKG